MSQKTESVLVNKEKGRRTLGKEIWKNRWFYLFIIPAIVVMFTFAYKPMYGVIIAFKDYKVRKGIMGSEWVGLYQFERLWKYPKFGQLIGNTLEISVLKLVTGMVSTLTLALLLNELRNQKFKKVIQTVSYLPHFISWIILGGIIRELFSPTRGVINHIIMAFGGQSIYFLADPNYFVGLLVYTNIWQGVGWSTIIYLAAIASIDQEMYESAMIDGASRLKRALYITIPSILPTVFTLLILNLGGILNAGFDQIFNLYNSQVYDVADIIDTYVYRVGLENFDYSYSAAVGLFKNAIGIVLVLGSNWFVKFITKGEHRIW